MRTLLSLLCFFLCAPVWAQTITAPMGGLPASPYGIGILNEGLILTAGAKGIDFRGAGVACTMGPPAQFATCAVSQTPAVSVLDFGAIVNDGLDDTAAIDLATAACTAAGGGIIWAPVGTYNISQITVGSNCTLRGDGMDATIFVCAATEPNICIHGSAGGVKATNADNYGAAVTNVAFEGFTLNGNGTARIAAALGGYVRGLVVAHDSQNVRVQGVKFVDGGSRALEVNPSRQVRVLENICENSSHTALSEGDCLHVGNPCNAGTREPAGWCDSAAKIAACRDVQMSHNTIWRQGDTALSGQYCSEVLISDNTVIGDEAFACAVDADCGAGGDCAVGGTCVPTTDQAGIETFGSSHVRILGNLIYKVRNSCFTTQAYTDALGTVWTPTDYVVSNNQCWRNTINASAANASLFFNGSSTANLKGLVVANNGIHDSPVAGIQLDANIEGFNVIGNTLMRTYTSGTGTTTEAGILLSGAATNVVKNGTVSGNYISGDESGTKMGYGIFQQYTTASATRLIDNSVLFAKLSPHRVRGQAYVHYGPSQGLPFVAANLAAAGTLGNALKGSMVWCNDCTYNATTGLCNTGGVGTAARWATKRDQVDGNWCCGSGMSEVAGTLLTTCG